MYRLTIEGNFSSAHQLRGYKGKCENLHGHNWKVVLTVRGETLNEIGILVDFHDLKAMLKGCLEELDHINVNDHSAFITQNPSSENIARYIYQDIERRLGDAEFNSVAVDTCTVFESETARCTYSE
jgi:6-pyruvoyltetrahydropterin/6-carboxytetrahydropterin synthase